MGPIAARFVVLPALITCLSCGAAIAQDAGDTLNNSITIRAIASGEGWQGPLNNPSSIYFDSAAAEVFVSDAGNGRVLIFDEFLIPKYAFVHYVIEPKTRRSIKGEPRDLVTNSLGDIILIDNRAEYIDVLDFRGKSLEKIYPVRLLDDTTLAVRPQRLAIDGDDNLYVLLLGDVTTILVLDQQYELVRQFGQKGGDFADFNTPLSMYVRDDRVYIADLYARPAIKIFSTAGAYIEGFAAHDVDRADVSFPSGITALNGVAAAQSVWVVDGLRQVVKVYDSEGQFIALVGGYGVNPGEFRYPNDIARSGDSTVYILERVGGRVQRFDITDSQ